jgi:hypothetical protein
METVVAAFDGHFASDELDEDGVRQLLAEPPRDIAYLPNGSALAITLRRRTLAVVGMIKLEQGEGGELRKAKKEGEDEDGRRVLLDKMMTGVTEPTLDGRQSVVPLAGTTEPE